MVSGGTCRRLVTAYALRIARPAVKDNLWPGIRSQAAHSIAIVDFLTDTFWSCSCSGVSSLSYGFVPSSSSVHLVYRWRQRLDVDRDDRTALHHCDATAQLHSLRQLTKLIFPYRTCRLPARKYTPSKGGSFRKRCSA
eukprot:6183177-Pleurochrysis_carterae.AAC.1